MTTKTLLAGILLVGLTTTASFAKDDTVNFHQSCKHGAIATFRMSEGVVFGYFDGKYKKPFKCKSGVCTKMHFTNGNALSYHRVVGSSQHIERHTVRCK